MRKRLLSLALALVMALALLPTAALAAEKSIAFSYNDVKSFSEGLAAVKLGAKWGFIDKTGNEVIPSTYDDAKSFSEGLAAVKLGGKWGFIDKAGQEVIPCTYDGVKSFSDGLAAVNVGGKVDGMNFKGGKWGFIEATGKEVVPPKYYEVSDFSEDVAAVCMDSGSKNKWGVIDKSGKEVVPCKYDKVDDFSEGLAAVMLDRKWGFIDTSGKEIVPCQYTAITAPVAVSKFSDGLAAVLDEYKWGFIDKTGKEVIPLKYDRYFSSVPEFSEGLAVVMGGNNWTVINTKDQNVMPYTLKYGKVNSFHEGLAAVNIEHSVGGSSGKWGFIDTDGREVVPCKYDQVHDFSGGFSLVQLDRKWGYVDKTGKEIVSCTYEDAKDFSEGFAAVKLKGTWGFLTIDGGTVLQPSFSKIGSAYRFHSSSDKDDFFVDPSGNTSTPTTPPTHKPVGDPKTFPDVAPDAWYAEAVNAMAANGVIKGGTDGLFRPDAPITYGELVTILARVSGVEDMIANGNYDQDYLVEGQGGYGRRAIDVSRNHTNHWAATAWARMNKFLNTSVPVVVEDLDCKVDRAGALDLVYATKYWMVNGNSTGKRHHTYKGTLEYAHNYSYSDIPGMQELIDTAYKHAPDDTDYAKSNQLGVVVLDEKLNLWPDEYIQHYDENGNLVPGYDMDMVAEYTAPFYKPVSIVHLGNILGAYNTGITTGVDANRTGNFTANITRAEVAVMLYRAGLDDVYEICRLKPWECPYEN